MKVHCEKVGYNLVQTGAQIVGTRSADTLIHIASFEPTSVTAGLRVSIKRREEV